jgi:hypothetical protein
MNIFQLCKEYDSVRTQSRIKIESPFDHTLENQIKINNEVSTNLLDIIKQSYAVESCYNITVNIYTPTIPSYRDGSYGFPFEPNANIVRTSRSVCCRQNEGAIALWAAKLKDLQHFVFLF